MPNTAAETTPQPLVWAFIPARGGSKSIPLKNLASLAGRPLLDYVIAAGLASPSLARIYCSTDHPDIAAHCRKRGILVTPRPDDLTGDDISTLQVILAFLQERRSAGDTLPDYLVLLQPTAPFVLPEHIDRSLAMLAEDPQADTVHSVAQVPHNHHAFSQRTLDKDGAITFVFTDMLSKYYNRQLKPVHFVFGNILTFRCAALLNNRKLYGEHPKGFTIPFDYATDIDDYDDLIRAEAVLEKGIVRLDHLGVLEA